MDKLSTTDSVNIITDKELACYHLTYSTLSEEDKLDDDHVIWLSNYITSIYNYGLLAESQLIEFLTYCNKNGICKLALTFNTELVNAVRTGNITSLNNLLSNPKSMFVELYDNQYLSILDREFLQHLVEKEIFSMSMMFNTNNSFARCYSQVCMKDGDIKGILSQHEIIPKTVTTIDKPGCLSPQIYCFDTIVLLDAITNKVPINPISKQPFSNYSLQLITKRFSKEIAMYRRYKK